ncbi:MAG: polysaccharide biosynthesis protein [Alphaproteobacteria bacterium]
MFKALRGNRAKIAYLHDVFMAVASFVIAQYLRLGESVFWYASEYIWYGAGLFAFVAAIVFASLDLYRGVWRYASLNDMVAILKAASLTVLIFLPLLFLITRLQDLPRSSLLINWLVLIALLGGPRAIYRVFKDRRIDTLLARDGRPRIPVLLVGAGDAAEIFIRAVNRKRQSNYAAVGIVGANPGRVGRQIHGVPVLGTLDDLPRIVAGLRKAGRRPRRMIITEEGFKGAPVGRLLDLAGAQGMTLARLPQLTDFEHDLGEEERLAVRPVALEDLLGRPQAVLDRPAMKALIAGKRVLITGAGGTIGSELVRQVSDFGPAHLTLLDNSEYHLYEIDRELADRHPDQPRSAVLRDVRDRNRLAGAFAEARPELVFHAAALKHVPMVENHPGEGVLTNIVGTRNVADTCRKNGVGTMVLISTDKAVNPSSVMGATKRLAENYCQALDLEGAGRRGATRFVTVRFGNVLGSTGSVVPLFQKQLEAGGPLTVTDADVSRYFMTVREAVELVLQASALAGGETDSSGKIFVLEMGEPVKILDLARQMIRLAGLEPEKDVEISFIGLRQGEKLHEELLHEAEETVGTRYRDILLAAPRTADHALLARAIDELQASAEAGKTEKTLAGLRRLVPEYGAGAARPKVSGKAS